MKVFKPLQLSLMNKTFTWLNKNQLAVTLLLGFPFDSRKEVLLEPELWNFLSCELGKDAMLDMCMPKPNGEFLVYGSYFAPGGIPVRADTVQVAIGSIDKSLEVIGDRYWRNVLAPTEPESFTQMPICYELAFGGKDYKKNPVGKGMDEVDVLGEMRLPMPNIEDPDRLVTAKSQRPEPAGLGPLDTMWEQRASRMGTYDEAWQRDYYPGYAPDLDWRHFNAAPPDQWIDAFWQGNESFHLLNLHAEKPELSGKLPAFRPRCFIEKRGFENALFTEVEMRAETVCLFPNVETGVMIYRGVTEVEEDDAADVEYMLAAYEDLDGPTRPGEYYEEALRNRLDEKQEFKFMMSTRDIIPVSERCGFARLLDSANQDGESALDQNIAVKAEAEKQKALDLVEKQKQRFKDKLLAANIDPTPHLEKLESMDEVQDDPQLEAIKEAMEKILPGSSSGDVNSIALEQVDFSQFDELAKRMDAMAEAKKEETRNRLRELIERVEGTEAEEQVREQVEAALKRMDELPDLPRPRVNGALDRVRDQLQKMEQARGKVPPGIAVDEAFPQVDVNLEAVERQLEEGLEAMKEMYRQGAHLVEGKPPHEEPMDIIQYRLQKLLEKGESLAGRDLAGVDMSNLDLSGRDLSGCFLEYTNFTDTNLKGANLQRAIITHANLSNADLTEADLRDSNLGDSNLGGANLTRAMLTNSELSKANLQAARLVECNIEGVNFLDSEMTGVDMSGSRINGANFLNLEFDHARFVGCDLQGCNFVQCTIESTDFSSANLSGSNFVECRLDNSRFAEAVMTNVRFPAGCSLRNCNFEKANLDQANLRDTDAENSFFEYASFHQADFSGANMQRGRFYGAQGKQALFMKTDLFGADFSSVNLMEGSLMKARLTNADLRYSNFYAAEFMDATIGGTNFDEANLDLTKLAHWRPSTND